MANEEIKVIADKEDIVAIADKVRTLDGISSAYTINGIADSVEAANSEIDVQTAKIAQLSTILDGKAAGGGGDGGDVAVEFVTLTCIGLSGSSLSSAFAFYDEENKRWDFVSCAYSINTERESYKVIKNSVVCLGGGMWSFNPSNAVQSDRDGVFRILSDVTATFD